MKPSDHPEFFRLPAPEGRSRESTIRLDKEGRFWHEGERVAHPKLEAAMHTWIARHPDDGRFILSNGHDWTYFTVDDTPFVVRAVEVSSKGATLILSDGSREPWIPAETQLGEDGALYATVKDGLKARFSRHAQTSLTPYLEEDEEGVWVKLGKEHTLLSPKVRRS